MTDNRPSGWQIDFAAGRAKLGRHVATFSVFGDNTYSVLVEPSPELDLESKCRLAGELIAELKAMRIP